MYSELNKLVGTGNRLLKGVEYLIDTSADGEQINGAAQLINSVGGVIKEFTKVNLMNIKHQQNIDLENLKHANKLKIAKAKAVSGSLPVVGQVIEDGEQSGTLVKSIAYQK